MAFFPLLNISDKETKVNAKTTVFGAQTFAEITRLCGGTFDGTTISERFWQTTLTGSGTATVANGVLTLATGNATGNSGALVVSQRTARYLTGNANFYIGGVRLGSLGDANNIKSWGAFDSQNGYIFQQFGGIIRIVLRKAGTDSAIQTFNGKPFVHDTNFHTYEIEYSASKVYFFQDGNLIHTVTNTLALPSATLHLKIGFENRNINNSLVNHTLDCRSVSINRHGKDCGRPQFYNLTNVAETRTLKQAPGTLHHVVIGSRGSGGATLTLYDSLTGTGSTIVTLDTVNTIGTVELDLDFFTGLTYVSSATVGNICLVFD